MPRGGLAREGHTLEVTGRPMKEETQDSQEIEWQFDALDVRPVSRWLKGDSWGRDPSVATGETREISDGYFDTEDWRIHRAGYALRIRHAGEKKVEATMKRLASTSRKVGVRNRREISEPLDAPEIDVLNGATGPVGDRVRALTGPEELRPLFEVRTRRSTYNLMLDGFRAGEIALDETACARSAGSPRRSLPSMNRASSRGASHRPRPRISGRPRWMDLSRPGNSPSGFCGTNSASFWPTSLAPGSVKTPRSCTTCGSRRAGCGQP
jgi:hypothetical protein